MTLLLTRGDVRGLVPMRAVIDAVEMAHRDMSSGVAHQPAPSSLSLSGSAAFLPMAALADRQQLAVVKFLADIPGNREKELPTQRSVLSVVSQKTGECIAMIDGMLLTRQRTAAASAVASRHLGRPDSKVLGLIGAGGLAEAHVEAMRAVLPIEKVVVWSRSEATVARFLANAASAHVDLDFQGVSSPRDVVANSDVVCTLTPSKDPIVMGEWFREGLHLNAVGAPPRRDHREIDGIGMARAKLVVDSVEVARHDSGDLLLAVAEGAIAPDSPLIELGDVILGRATGRGNFTDITLFNSVGIAMQDLAIAHLLIDAARQAGLGVNFDFGGPSR